MINIKAISVINTKRWKILLTKQTVWKVYYLNLFKCPNNNIIASPHLLTLADIYFFHSYTFHLDYSQPFFSHTIFTFCPTYAAVLGLPLPSPLISFYPSQFTPHPTAASPPPPKVTRGGVEWGGGGGLRRFSFLAEAAICCIYVQATHILLRETSRSKSTVCNVTYRRQAILALTCQEVKETHHPFFYIGKE